MLPAVREGAYKWTLLQSSLPRGPSPSHGLAAACETPRRRTR